MRIAGPIVLVLLVGPLSGCVMRKDVERLENQIQLLDKRVELLQEGQEKAGAQILEGWKRLRRDLEQEMGSVQRSSVDSTTRMDDLIRQMQQLADKIDKTGQQYERLSEQLALVQDRVNRQPSGPMGLDVSADAPGGAELGTGADGQIPTGGPGMDAGAEPGVGRAGALGGEAEMQPEGSASEPAAPAFDSSVDPDMTYKAAYSDYAQGNFKLAILNFQTYVRQFPTSAKAVLAQYFIGESYYALGQYRQAVEAFDKVISGWPGDEKVPVAYLKKGYALLAMGQRAVGLSVLQELISRHPNTHEALLARERLSAP